MNEILGDHNVDKQITDNKGDVSILLGAASLIMTDNSQVAYLMADISNVQTSEIKEISDNLEALSCKSTWFPNAPLLLIQAARILTRILY